MQVSLAAVIAASFLLSTAGNAEAGERIIYDSYGKAHRIPDINYVPPVIADGIFPKMVREPQPLQLINPFADRKYGYGRGMVSWDRSSGKPKGFIAFGLRIW